MKGKAIVLWSGGKDCNLALQLAKQEGYNITALVTFCSESTEFRAHPKELMELQSKSLGIPHLFLKIREPFAENYELQLRKLKEQLEIEIVVSGDISEVHESPNWISERAKAVGLKTFLPLWHAEREDVMALLLKFNFEVILTMVKAPWLEKHFLGRRIDLDLLEEFRILGRQNGLDLCGEQGEYHTMVLDGPGYRTPIKLENYSLTQLDEMTHLSELKLSLDGDYHAPALEKRKKCVNCQKPFSCYTDGCWCAELPMIMPMENITDCLCPNCLKAAIDEKLNEK
ncbi:ATP-binding region [compost metagenome]